MPFFPMISGRDTCDLKEVLGRSPECQHVNLNHVKLFSVNHLDIYQGFFNMAQPDRRGLGTASWRWGLMRLVIWCGKKKVKGGSNGDFQVGGGVSETLSMCHPLTPPPFLVLMKKRQVSEGA